MKYCRPGIFLDTFSPSFIQADDYHDLVSYGLHKNTKEWFICLTIDRLLSHAESLLATDMNWLHMPTGRRPRSIVGAPPKWLSTP